MKLKFLCVVLVVVLAGCSVSTTNSIQEEAVQVADASNNGASPEEMVDEVDDVMDILSANGADFADSSFEGYGLTYVVDGERFTNQDILVMAQTPVPDYYTVTSPDALGIQLRMLPNELGIFEAGEGPSQYRLVDVWFPHEGKRYDANKDVGSATIIITEVGTNSWPYAGDVAGTFSGTFVASDGSSIEVTAGEFRGTGQ